MAGRRAGKTSIVPASRVCPAPARTGSARRAGKTQGAIIFAINVKIGRVLVPLGIPKNSFGYNAGYAQRFVLPQGDASPSTVGTPLAVQVRAVGSLTAIRYRCVRCTRLAQPGA